MSKKEPSTIELGALFLCASKSAAVAFEELSAINKKREYGFHLCIALSTTMSIEDADIVVANSLTTLNRVRSFLTDNTVVVLCDSPLVLSMMPDAQKLDFENETRSYIFKYGKPNYTEVFKQARKPKGYTFKATSIDVLGIVMENNVQDAVILPSYNDVQSYFDMEARHALRQLVLDVLVERSESKLSPIQEFLKAECRSKTHKEAAVKLLSALKDNAKKIRAAFDALDKGKSVAYAAKKGKISEFEINYFRKLLRGHVDANARTVRYTETIARGSL